MSELKQITYPGITFKQEYMIDEDGNVYSPWRGLHKMQKFVKSHGYEEIMLYTTEGRRHFKIHRLVMNTFCPIENSEQLQVNHIDGNKTNNNINNLEWCTREENMKHCFKLGLQSVEGEKNPAHKLNGTQVIEICELLLDGLTSREIAEKYGVTKGTIDHIRQKRSWKHITQDYSFY